MADPVALAKRLIDKNGRSVSIVRLSQTVADPTKPWRGPASPRGAATIVTGLGVFVPLGGSDLGVKFSTQEPDSQVCMFPAVDDQGVELALEDFDEVVDGVTRWKIVETQVLKPGASRVMYFFVVKQ